MDRRFYQTGQFAQKAAVSVRTLRFYDKVGLLSPSQHTEAGYRLYTDDDLVSLQQILALKFLGFPLEEIKRYLQTDPRRLQEVLARQKAMMREKRTQLDTIIQAIEQAEKLMSTGPCDWEPIVHVIQVIQMEQNNDWVNKYFTPEQRRTMDELSNSSYSDEARQQLAARGPWTEEDQRRVDQQYAHLASELKRVVAEGKDPGSPEAQALAKLQIDLLHQFTQGSPEITTGLKKLWQNHEALPAEKRPFSMPWSDEEGAFLSQAMAIYQQRQGESGEA
ncbi:MAG TPA: MerR family transcriptional regulator [Herpetosiphonaceae bacterium]